MVQPMSTFAIDPNHNVTAFTSLKEARAAQIKGAEYFSSSQDLANLANSWPATRLVDGWNHRAGVPPFDPLKPVKKFTSRKVAVARIWRAVQTLLRPGEPSSPGGEPNRGSATKPSPRPRGTTRLEPVSRKFSKQAEVMDLMRRPAGATLAEIMDLTAWQAHSVRGFVSGTLKKKLGLRVESFRTEARERTYKIRP